nr:MAG TPA: hypothetical protein [Caudoviricetes sp.]
MLLIYLSIEKKPYAVGFFLHGIYYEIEII